MYVATPEFIRALDAQHMATALVDVPWAQIQTAIAQHYANQAHGDKLWVASSMVQQGAARVLG